MNKVRLFIVMFFLMMISFNGLAQKEKSSGIKQKPNKLKTVKQNVQSIKKPEIQVISQGIKKIENDHSKENPVTAKEEERKYQKRKQKNAQKGGQKNGLYN